MSDSHPILSLAFVESAPGREADTERVLIQIREICASQGYSRDELFRHPHDPHLLVLARYWSGADARRQAQEDPALHRLWRELALICKTREVYEELIPI